MASKNFEAADSALLVLFYVITKTCLFKYTENFTTKKRENFQTKKSDIFLISAQNIDCGYSLEPPRRGGSLFVLRFYGPVNPMGLCRARSVYLTTRLLGRLSPLNG